MTHKVLFYIKIEGFVYNKFHFLKYNQSISRVLSDILINNHIKWQEVLEVEIKRIKKNGVKK